MRNRITLNEFYTLTQWMSANTAALTDLDAVAMAKCVTTSLGPDFLFGPKVIRRAADAVGIPRPKKAPAAKLDPVELLTRLAQLEARVVILEQAISHRNQD